MHCLLPPPQSFSLDKEVAGNEEGIDSDNINDVAKDINTTANYDAPTDDDIDYATLPPKVKPIPTRAAIKKESAAAAAKPPPPAAAAASASFSVDKEDPLMTHYYADRVYDYAGVVFRVN